MDKKELIEQCKHVAKNFEAYANGNIYECPHCNELINTTDECVHDGECCTIQDVYEKQGFIYCPCCYEMVQFNDYDADNYAEQLGLIDYLNDVFDIEITRSGLSADSPIRDVRVCVAFGGPNIYLDTNDCLVKLYWWGDHVEYMLDTNACAALDELVEELTAC